jgi:hypothetical protein
LKCVVRPAGQELNLRPAGSKPQSNQAEAEQNASNQELADADD